MEKFNKEILIGKFAADNLSIIHEGLEKIQHKYQNYFNERETRFEETDKLANHYTIEITPNSVKFFFYEDSDLDEEIKSDCIEFIKTLGLSEL